jgi:hypothetical protein
MWIAKPLRALSAEEQSAWLGVLQKARDRGEEAPLAQSLGWGSAIEAVSGRVHAVFSPDESVGGLVFATPSKDGVQFECINGPLLDWDDEEAVKRQLAVFATAVSRLSESFARLVLRPRWTKDGTAQRLARLPIPSAGTLEAATLKLSLAKDPEASFSARLRRTLKRAERAAVSARWDEIDSSNLVEFALAAQAFGRARGFTVPPIFWFKALTDSGDPSLRFGLVTAQTPDLGTGCQLFIAFHQSEAHYLFGHEWRAEPGRAALSPQAVAQRFAIRHARQAGMETYDFNGALENPEPGHPYQGVARFKAQFGAELVPYVVPELKIEA